MRTICLCDRHLKDYINCYIVKRDWKVKEREQCEWCDKLGNVFIVEERPNEKAKR